MAYRPYETDEKPRPRNDAYTGILAISFFAMLIAALLLLVDWYSYEGMKPAKTKDLLTPLKPVAVQPPKGDVAKPPVKKDDAPKPMPDQPEPKNGKGDPKMEKGDKMEKGGDKMEKKDDAKKDDAKKDDAKKDDAKKDEK